MTLMTWNLASYNNNISFVRMVWDSPDWQGDDDIPADPNATGEISSLTYKNMDPVKTFFIEVNDNGNIQAWDFAPSTPQTTINIPKPQRPVYHTGTVISAGYRVAVA